MGEFFTLNQKLCKLLEYSMWKCDGNDSGDGGSSVAAAVAIIIIMVMVVDDSNDYNDDDDVGLWSAKSNISFIKIFDVAAVAAAAA